jgi:hypothetical protein
MSLVKLASGIIPDTARGRSSDASSFLEETMILKYPFVVHVEHRPTGPERARKPQL